MAIVCVAAGGWVRAWLTPAFGPTALPFISFFPAVAGAAWYGGFGPAALSTLLAALTANWFFIEPVHAFSVRTPYDGVAILAFIIACLLIVCAIEAMHWARRELAQARDLLATTLASIGDGVVVTDERGRVTFLNAEAERLTGWKSSEAAGRPLDQVFHILNETTRQPAENPVDKVLQLGKVVGLANHTILISKDGKQIPIDDSAAPIKQPDGPLSGVVLVFRDFTEQRQAEATRGWLAAIVENSSDAVFSKDLEGTIRSWNASAQRLFGYRPEEIIGQPIFRLIPPDRMGEEDRILESLRKGEPTGRVETVRLSKDGRKIPVSISVSPIKDQEGRVIGASKIIHDITDIVAAREEIIRQKELLATTLSSIGDGVIVTDAEGRVTFLNAEAERLTGWKNSEAAGQPLPTVFKIVNESTRQIVENPVDQVLRLGTVVGLANHTLLISKAGAETPIDDSAAPIREPQGSLFGVVLVFRDFTERRRAEEAMRASEERLQTAITAGRMGTWEWTISTGRVIWSDTLERIHGLQPGTFGGTIEDFQSDVHPDDSELLKSEIKKALKSRKDYHVTYRIQVPGGEVRWLEAFGKVLLDARGEPERMAGVCMDVTERKRAEETLRESRQQLANILGSAMDAVLTVNEEQRVVLFNEAAEKMFGCPAAEAIGKPLDRFIPERFRASHRQHIVRFGQTGVTARSMGALQPLAGLRADGEEFPIEASISQTKQNGKKLFTVILRDITERERAEESLREEKKRLERTNLELDSFVYIASHDLKAPLRGIASFAGMLNEEYKDRLDEEGREYLGEIEKSAEKMSGLIKDLLALSRLSRIHNPYEIVDIDEVVKMVLERLSHAVKEYKGKIKIEKGLPKLHCDRIKITEVFVNLIHNAMKFSSKSEVREVAVGSQETPDGFQFHVKDSGVGVAPEYHEKIFDMFTRLHSDREFEGTGTGLYIVKRIVEDHGGKIWVESKPGRGATFFFTIPKSLAGKVNGGARSARWKK